MLVGPKKGVFPSQRKRSQRHSRFWSKIGCDLLSDTFLPFRYLDWNVVAFDHIIAQYQITHTDESYCLMCCPYVHIKRRNPEED